MPARDRRRRRALVVGGSWSSHGDPALAGIAALYAGAGEVYVAAPSRIADSIRCASPDLSVVPMPDQKLTRGAAAWIARHVRGVDAAYLGAGFHDAGGASYLALELASAGARLVLGSEGAGAGVLARLSGAGRRFVALYDEEEFARAFGPAAPGDDDPAEPVRRAAAEVGGVVAVLGQLMAASDGAAAFSCPSGPSAWPAGSVSVMGGLLTGLVALGMDDLKAAAAAGLVMGLARDAASSRMGFHWGASALLDELPGILMRFDYARP
ncbi:MAG: NAD(P)H-hydrate dehydratase [Nitrososphaeria archaeon]